MNGMIRQSVSKVGACSKNPTDYVMSWLKGFIYRQVSTYRLDVIGQSLNFIKRFVQGRRPFWGEDPQDVERRCQSRDRAQGRNRQLRLSRN